MTTNALREHQRLRALRRTAAALTLAAVPCALAAPRALAAQLPGLPVATNAFVRPGVAAAVNGGWGDGRSTFGIAASYGHRSRLFSVTAGAAAFDGRELGGDKNETAWGVRALVRGLSLGHGRGAVSPFIGIGGVSVGEDDTETGLEGKRDLLTVPLGAAVSWRTSIGGNRVIAASVAPFASWNQRKADGDDVGRTLLRFSAAVDVAVTRRAGVTLAWEGGSSAADDEPGPRGSLFGLGFSFGFGGR